MNREARIFIGDSLRRIGGFGLLVAILPATTSDDLHLFRWALLGSALTVVAGQLVYVWGGGPKARRAERAAQAAAADKPERPTEPRRPTTVMPSDGIVMMTDFAMVDKMMATMKKIIDAKKAGNTMAAARVERKLEKLVQADPVTAERITRLAD